MNKITIVWQRPKNATWETDWIHWLFSDITDNIVDNLDHSLYLDNSVLIDCLVWAPYHNNYAREMRRRGLRFGLVHLTDEGSDNDISSYTDCDFVIRMFMRKCIQDYVLTIPIGYTSGTANNNAIASGVTVAVGTTNVGAVVTGAALTEMSYVTVTDNTTASGTVTGFITYFVTDPLIGQQNV